MNVAVCIFVVSFVASFLTSIWAKTSQSKAKKIAGKDVKNELEQLRISDILSINKELGAKYAIATILTYFLWVVCCVSAVVLVCYLNYGNNS